VGRMLKAMIVDDEEGAIKLLSKLLNELQVFREIRTAGSTDSALTEISNFDPDLIFLDIRMPGKDGFAFLNDLPSNSDRPAIVIVTAYDQYAIKAIKTQAFDYLLKPINRKELKTCVQKYIEMHREPDNGKIKNSNELKGFSRIRINSRTGVVFINPSTVLYCKADGNYTNICTGDKVYLCSMNLGKVEELLSGKGFIRVGRSYIFNIEYMRMLDRKESTLTLVREGETVKIKIPKQHMKDLDQI
jgi:DNA-binding LytR/AlgR family response regulator